MSDNEVSLEHKLPDPIEINLNEEIKPPENEKDSITNSNNSETDTALVPDQSSELCDIIEQQKEQLISYLSRINRLEESFSRLHHSHKDLEHKYETAVKQKDNAVKEKESMVMRYAVSEKSQLQIKSGKEHAEKKLKETMRENELLQQKLTSMTAEKSRICLMLDNKCYELKSSQQELEKTKADLGALETKLKWSQNSLKNEIELRKESESKAETLSLKIQGALAEAEKAKKDAADSIREFHTSQDNRAHVLDQQMKEVQASLILLKHERNDREQHAKALQGELERCLKKQGDTLQENNALSIKVQQLEKDRSELEQRLSELRECADQQKHDAADLNIKSAQVEQLKLQLQNEQEQSLALNEQIVLLKQRNADLLSDMESCRTHEAELLSFTHQLTDKNVQLQSEFSTMETKVQQLSCEQTLLKRNIKELETKTKLLSSQLLEERNTFNNELDRVVMELGEKNKLCDKLTQEVADQRGENCVIKRKLELSLREVTKELAHCRKRLEQYEGAVGTSSSSGSSNSLNNVDNNHRSATPTSDKIQIVQPEREFDKQTLFDHIVKLQKISAKKSEKLDFLEEHVNTLVMELQKKTRLIQGYILREQSGALSSNLMDSNKANLAKYTGIMASMYGSKKVDTNLTLELSLDINRKLQAVLEDALLKNITLKENVDTLGAEIDKLLKHKNESKS